MANIITAIVIAAKIVISVMIYDAESCCIIKVRIADIYHLAGIIQFVCLQWCNCEQKTFDISQKF